MEKRRNENLNRCEAALNSEWSTVVKEARWILHKILFYISWTNWEVWVLLFLLFVKIGFSSPGMLDSLDCLNCLHLTTNFLILQTAPPDWTADPGRSTTSLQKTAHTQTCGRKSKLLKVNHWVSPGTPRRKLRATKCWATASRDVKATGSTMSGR